MKVDTQDGIKVAVRWQYETVDVIVSDKLIGTTTETTCFIETGNPEEECIFKQSVRQYKNDPFNKETARKESLKKVLHLNLYPIDKENDNEETITLAKTGRKIFWDAYKNRNVKKVSNPLRGLDEIDNALPL